MGALRALLVLVMAISACLTISSPHPPRSYARAWVENRTNPTPESQARLDKEEKRKMLVEVSFQLFFLGVFAACGFGVIKVSRRRNDYRVIGTRSV
jgi:hypothetical protein